MWGRLGPELRQQLFDNRPGVGARLQQKTDLMSQVARLAHSREQEGVLQGSVEGSVLVPPWAQVPARGSTLPRSIESVDRDHDVHVVDNSWRADGLQPLDG